MCVCMMLTCGLQSLVRFRGTRVKLPSGRDEQAKKGEKKTRELSAATRGSNDQKPERLKRDSQSTSGTTISGTIYITALGCTARVCRASRICKHTDNK